MKYKTKVVSLLKLIFPCTRQETFVFLICLLFYSVFAHFIAMDYRIVYDERIPWDGYFSFDNHAIVNTGGGFERHPLANYFFSWIQDFALLISDGKKDSIFRLVLALLSSLTISLSIVQIFKYLKNIIKLSSLICFLLVLFYAFFTTNILLSFTPETYTYTLFLLCLFNYYVAKKYQEGKSLSYVGVGLAAVSVGGLTITNISKIYLPLLFEKNLFWNWRKIGNSILKVVLSLAVFVLLFLYRLDFNISNFISKTEEQYDKFSNPKVTPLWDMMYSWFFGGNMIFPSFMVRDYHNKKGFDYKAIFMDTYSNWIPYFFVGLILALIIWSLVKNFKNQLVQILLWSFAIDIVIHCVMKFGLHTSYIYGGHFVFVFPLLIGWLFYAYRGYPKVIGSLLTVVGVTTGFMIINNILRLGDFIDFLNLYYK